MTINPDDLLLVHRAGQDYKAPASDLAVEGIPGKDLTFDDLTDEQKEALKGEQGPEGPVTTIGGLTNVSASADSASNEDLLTYQGAEWVAKTPAFPKITYGDTAPSSPNPGDFWFNPTTFYLGIYVDGGWLVVNL